MKVEIGVRYLPVKGYQLLPAKHQKLGERHGTESPAQTSEETNFADTLILDF